MPTKTSNGLPTPVPASRRGQAGTSPPPNRRATSAASVALSTELAKKAKKIGRPSKFGTVDMELVQKLAEYGHDDKFMATCCGVSEVTWNAWKKGHPEFLKSLKDWKDVADNEVVKALFERAKGCSCIEERFVMQNGKPKVVRATKYYPPDPTSMIFWLKNRQPGQWRDKQELQHSGGLSVHVSITADKPEETPKSEDNTIIDVTEVRRANLPTSLQADRLLEGPHDVAEGP